MAGPLFTHETGFFEGDLDGELAGAEQRGADGGILVGIIAIASRVCADHANADLGVLEGLGDEFRIANDARDDCWAVLECPLTLVAVGESGVDVLAALNDDGVAGVVEDLAAESSVLDAASELELDFFKGRAFEMLGGGELGFAGVSPEVAGGA